MNQYERDEIAALRTYLNKIVFGFVGMMVTVALAAFSWEISQENRVSVALQTATEARLANRENLAEIKSVSRQANDSRSEITGLAVQIAAQGETLKRIDATLVELRGYFRGRPQ